MIVIYTGMLLLTAWTWRARHRPWSDHGYRPLRPDTGQQAGWCNNFDEGSTIACNTFHAGSGLGWSSSFNADRQLRWRSLKMAECLLRRFRRRGRGVVMIALQLLLLLVIPFSYA